MDSDGGYYEYHFQTDGALHYESPAGFWRIGTWKQDERSIYIPPPSYRDHLLAELDGIQTDFLALLDKSAIVQRRQPSGEGVVIVGLARNKWADSDHALERAQMLLLGRLRSWELRVRLLFPVATPAFESRYVKRLRLLTGWAERRKGNDPSVPGSIAARKQSASRPCKHSVRT